MKLAEALQERKNIEKEIDALWQRVNANLYRAEDDQRPDEDPRQLLIDVHLKLDRLEWLIKSINKTNIEARATPGLTIMSAIARRDRLNREVKGLQAALGIKGTDHMALFAAIRSRRTTKDELKYVPAIPIADVKAQHDQLAKELRELDVEIQRANWNVDLLESGAASAA